MENFFANMKREELYRAKNRSEKEFKNGVQNYIQFYNEDRPHSKNKYKTLKGSDSFILHFSISFLCDFGFSVQINIL